MRRRGRAAQPGRRRSPRRPALDARRRPHTPPLISRAVRRPLLIRLLALPSTRARRLARLGQHEACGRAARSRHALPHGEFNERCSFQPRAQRARLHEPTRTSVRRQGWPLPSRYLYVNANQGSPRATGGLACSKRGRLGVGAERPAFGLGRISGGWACFGHGGCVAHERRGGAPRCRVEATITVQTSVSITHFWSLAAHVCLSLFAVLFGLFLSIGQLESTAKSVQSPSKTSAVSHLERS